MYGVSLSKRNLSSQKKKPLRRPSRSRTLLLIRKRQIRQIVIQVLALVAVRLAPDVAGALVPRRVDRERGTGREDVEAPVEPLLLDRLVAAVLADGFAGQRAREVGALEVVPEAVADGADVLVDEGRQLEGGDKGVAVAAFAGDLLPHVLSLARHVHGALAAWLDCRDEGRCRDKEEEEEEGDWRLHGF